jgi:hypothetical protein
MDGKDDASMGTDHKYNTRHFLLGDANMSIAGKGA